MKRRFKQIISVLFLLLTFIEISSASIKQSSVKLNNLDSFWEKKILTEIQTLSEQNWVRENFKLYYEKFHCNFTSNNCQLSFKVSIKKRRKFLTEFAKCKINNIHSPSDLFQSDLEEKAKISDTVFNQITKCIDLIEKTST